MIRTILALIALTGLVACGGSRTKQTEPRRQQRVFLPALPPSHMPQEEIRAYMGLHYWDKLDFTDTLFIMEVDSQQMLEAFAIYAGNFLDPAQPETMDSLMRRASASKRMLQYFASMSRRVLADPNSPLRNDELYIPVLEALVASPYLSDVEKLAPQSELQMAMQNRVGHKANDIRYTLASGKSYNLYGLQADYVLLFLNNPGCPMCREIHEAIVASPMLSDLVRRGKLVVLALYPDEDLEEWEAYRSQMPPTWINAYDKGCRLLATGSYNISAIPALYLLDRDKRVLVKDATDVGLIEWTIDQRL